jgi:CheY-like chemotaxis protein
MSALRILIVEDNEDTAMLFAEMLELAGHRVTVAHDAREGLRAAAEFELDVVLCDIGLPGELDGFGFAERMRERADSRAPALISLSGYGRREDEERALRSGFDRHLTKPINLASLQRAIGNVLEQRNSGR